MFRSEHVARRAEPDRFARFERKHPEGWPEGVDAIYGLTDTGVREVQSVRFDVAKYTKDDAHAWLEAQQLSTTRFDEAGDPYRPDTGVKAHVYGSGASARFDSEDVPEGTVEYREDATAVELVSPTLDPTTGFMRARGAITRAGVFSYYRNGKVVREFRPPEEVLKASSLESFELAPLTLEHPPENLKAEIASKYVVGSIGHLAPATDHASARLLIHHPRAIEAVQNGARFLSAGYTMRAIERKGVYVRQDGIEEPFDLVQTEIIGNHTALTRTPRGGSTTRIDSSEQLDGVAGNRECPEDMRIKLGTSEFEIPDAAGAALQQELNAVRTLVTQATADRDQAQGRADALDAELKKAKAETEKTVRHDAETKSIEERAELVSMAAPILKKTIAEVSRMDSKEIMAEVIKVAAPSVDTKDKSVDYLRGIFDTAVKSVQRVDSADQIRRAGEGAIFHTPRTDADEKASLEIDAAQKRMIEDQRNAWKPKSAS